MDFTVEDWTICAVVASDIIAYTLMWNLLSVEILRGWWFPLWLEGKE